MHRTLSLLALLAACAAAPAFAQRVPGSVLVLRVTDEAGHPLNNAEVQVAGSDRRVASDSHGGALLTDIPPGNRIVEVHHPGFALARVAADFVGGDTVRREVHMTPQPVELEGVTATSWGRSMRLRNIGFYDRQRRGIGSFLTQEEIARFSPMRTNEIFRRMRGVTILKDRRGNEAVVSTRGGPMGRPCPLQVYVDGLRLTMSGPRDQQETINAIPWADIAAVEVYNVASMPAEYNVTGNACGIILIWTGQ